MNPIASVGCTSVYVLDYTGTKGHGRHPWGAWICSRDEHITSARGATRENAIANLFKRLRRDLDDLEAQAKGAAK